MVEDCSFGRKIGIFGVLHVVLHGFLVVSVTKKFIILQSREQLIRAHTHFQREF